MPTVTLWPKRTSIVPTNMADTVNESVHLRLFSHEQNVYSCRSCVNYFFRCIPWYCVAPVVAFLSKYIENVQSRAGKRKERKRQQNKNNRACPPLVHCQEEHDSRSSLGSTNHQVRDLSLDRITMHTIFVLAKLSISCLTIDIHNCVCCVLVFVVILLKWPWAVDMTSKSNY